MLVPFKYDRGLMTTMLTKLIIVAVPLVYCGMIFVIKLGSSRTLPLPITRPIIYLESIIRSNS